MWFQFVQSDPPTSKTLSTLIIQMLQFQEDALGKSSQKPPMTRIPVKYFMDFKPGGAVCVLLTAAYKFKTEQNWRKFEFQLNKVW